MERFPVFFYVAYNGAFFVGWQSQKNGESVSDYLAHHWQRVFQDSNIRIHGASRTDSGVHAWKQGAVAFVTKEQLAELSDPRSARHAYRLRYSLNNMMKAKCYIHDLFLPPGNFGVRQDSRRKAYLYVLRRNSLAPFVPWGWSVTPEPDIRRLRDLAKPFQGWHDFSAFAKQASLKVSPRERYLYPIRIWPKGGLIFLFFMGNGFLHHQVRIMVGTLVRLASNDRVGVLDGQKLLQQMLAGQNYVAERFTAPAQGLFLHLVYYSAAHWRRFVSLTGAETAQDLHPK